MAANGGILSINNIINISLTLQPQSLRAPNMNSLALFTTETPDNFDPYRIYLEPTTVGVDYGTNSETAKLASAIFSQSPNILSGAGRLVIIPLLASVSATSGSATTPDISANLATILAVTDGSLGLTIDGVTENIANVNFSNAATFDDIRIILQAKIQNAIVSIVGGNSIRFTSKKVGTASTIAISAGTGGTDLALATLFNTGSVVPVAGVNSSGETIQAAITRTSTQVQYVGIVTNLLLDDAALQNASDAIQALENIFVYGISSVHDIDGIATDIKDAGNFNTRVVLYSSNKTDAVKFAASYASRYFAVNFAGTNTATTMHLKRIVGMVPDTLTQTIYNKCEAAGVDLYANFGIPGIVSNGANQYADTVYNKLALKQSLQVAGFNYLATTTTKIPQTEPGMDGLKGAFGKVADSFVRNGVLGTGLTWNSPDTFGDPEDFARNITDSGYYIYSLPIAQQNQPDREARIAPLVQMAFKFGGALHHVDVIGVVQQ
jgi:hypothetical protein